MPSLSAETLRLLRTSFAAVNHSPSELMWRGIKDLADHLQRMADGECESRFYLSSLDPGVGKTQAVIHFLRALLASPQHDHVGVVIFFYTKQQIQEVVDKAALRPSDFAVLMTAEEEAEQELIHRGNSNIASARVLFTTQQRLQLVCRDKSFSDVAIYHFRGLPRQVRIWDEALLPATEIVVRAYDIPGLIPAISGLQPEFVDHVNHLCARLHGAADREVVSVPNLAASQGLTLSRLLGSGRGLSSDEKRLATDFWSLFGTSVSVRYDGRRGPAMVSYRRSVPDDLAPVVILDASGRVRTAYDWWHEHRRTLHRLTPVKKHYDKLTVHVWDIGGGQSSFQREEARYWRTSGIVKTINRRSSDKWLVVCHKAFRKEVEADIRRELKGDPERVSFLHWGIHRASNEFCDVPNIILAGTQFLPTSSYEGIGRAARGILPSEGEITKELQRQIELGELGDRVLQAACRGVVRKALGDKCPPCNVYIIASAGSGLRELLPTIFPGCGIETWEPAPPRLRGKPAKALKFMKEWFADHPGELLSVTLVMEAIDESSRANFNKNIRKHPAFKLNLGKEGICEERSASGRRCIGFTQELEEDDAPTAADFLIDGKEAAKYISALISARQRLIGLVSEHGKLLIELIGARGKPSHPIMPVDLARVADLAPGELVLLECPCGHKAMLSALMLMKRRVKLDRKIADLKQMRCKECGERGGAAVSITRKA